MFVDARHDTVHVACYPFPDGKRVPQDRLGSVAELMNLIACTGVPFALALDFEHGVISFRNLLHFTGTNAADRAPLLRDLITSVAPARLLYAQPFSRVAFEGVDPATALADLEARLDELGAD